MKTDSSLTSWIRSRNSASRLPRTPFCLMIVLIVLVQVAAAWAAGTEPTARSGDVLPLFAVARFAAGVRTTLAPRKRIKRRRSIENDSAITETKG